MDLSELSIHTLLGLLEDFAAMNNYDPVGSQEERLERDYPGVTQGAVRREILSRVPFDR